MIKSSPFDIQTFRQETSVKYPTFSAVSLTSEANDFNGSRIGDNKKSNLPISPVKLAQAFSPIPVRHHYHHGDETDFQQPSNNPGGNSTQPVFPSGNPTYNPNPQSLTPAPTPPPSPKPKKQQYQTDQSRPFLFPFSRSQVRGRGGSRLVPFAIDEADRLYNKHMHISVSLLQMWRAREDCMIEESGLQRLAGPNGDFETFDSVLSLNSRNAEGSSASNSAFSTNEKKIVDDTEETSEELPDMALLDSKIVEVDAALKQLDRTSSRSEAKKYLELKEQREDMMRLKRVEQIYVSFYDEKKPYNI